MVVTPSQLGALTTVELASLQSYLRSPGGRTLEFFDSSALGTFVATNFEFAELAVVDDGRELDVSNCFLAVTGTAQIIVGTAAADVLNGTQWADLILGLGGDDTLLGHDGSDCLLGGAGNDTLTGGALHDQLFGGGGDDWLSGESGNDTLRGELGDDSLFGGDGFDTLLGDAGADWLDGGLNDDYLDGGSDADSLYGGPGFDVLYVRDAEAEFDVLNGGENTDTVVNANPAAPVVLNGFDATISQIEGWSGGGQPIVGNDGANTLSFQITSSSSMTLSGVPYVDGRGGDDTIRGTNGADDLRGGDGNDTLLGFYGSDRLSGGAGDDFLDGGEGVDYLDGGAGGDRIISGGGRDQIYFTFAANDVAPELDNVEDFTTSDRLNFQGQGWTYAMLGFDTSSAPGHTIVNLPNGKKIRLQGRTSPPPAYVFVFLP